MLGLMASARTSDDQVKIPNPAILAILDPLHRSLLNNNLQYEQALVRRDDKQPPAESDSDEYLTAISGTTDTTADPNAITTSNKFIDAANKKNDSHVKEHRQLNRTHVEQRKETDLMHDDFDSGNRLTEKNRQLNCFDNSKQTPQQSEHLNVLDTKTRCDTIHQANVSNSIQHQRRATAWSRSNEQITHKLSRRSARNSLENKAPLSSCCNHRANDDYHIKRCKRLPPNVHSDSSDVNSETNLVIENMRNRECEMYRKISFNNGYFDATDSSSSGSYMYCRSNANSIETTSFHSRNKKCLCKTGDWSKKSPKSITKRKCRSFPLTENQQQIEQRSEHVIQNQTRSRLNGAQSVDNNGICRASETETATNTYQTNSRKITITIKTRTVPEQSVAIQPPTQSNAIDRYLTNASELSDESDTTVSDYATLCSESDANTIQTLDCNHKKETDIESSDESDGSDDNSFFSIKSDFECQSESSQYFNCASFTDLNLEQIQLSTENLNEQFPSGDCSTETTDIAPKFAQKHNEVNQIRSKTVKHMQTKNSKQMTKSVAMKRSSVPMICIEQELCENRIVTSKIEVDKQKIKEFKRRQKKRSQPKIIVDNTFSEEIFNETLNQSICCDKNVIDDITTMIVSSLETDKCESDYQKVINNHTENAKNKFISDGFMFDKLQGSPKYTSKSISRLLAQRTEQQSITSVRRTLLQNVAYAITEKDKLQKIERKKLLELAPIKPPRSFTASSSSSPLSKQSFESSATIPISELNRHEQNAMGFVMPSHQRLIDAKYEPVGEESTVHFGWVRPQSNVDNDDPPESRYVTADQFSSSTNHSVNQNRHQINHQINSGQNFGFCVPKEDIDTVDSSSRSNKDFERFSSNLSENRQNNLSTPIKNIASHDNKYVSDAPAMPIQKTTQSINQTETICKTCHCKVKKEKPQHVLLSKRIGKAALKRTKTFIGTSKRLLKKPSSKDVDVPKEKEIFSTPLKDGDNTVCNNRDTISREGYKKRVDKSLNLTPKELNENVVALRPSPKRNAEISNVRLLKDAPVSMDDSEQYATPDEAFDFNRVVNLPQHQVKVVKRSPSKMILKLAKSSKKLFNKKGRDKDKRRSSTDESTHYYKANDYDEVDNKVLLMGEMLSEMRKQIENGTGSTNNIDEATSERPPSAKKCLFRERTISTSSGDLLEQESLVEKIATIDLHDEPEPLYAEIIQAKPAKAQETTYFSVQEDDVNAITNCNSTEPIQLKEVYINDRSATQPSKYIMVNNNPKILYATVNRNSIHARSLETIESRTEHSEDQVDGDDDDKQSFRLSSSYESLDMSLINDFATAVQTELDECQFKMNEMFATAIDETDDHGECNEIDAQKIDRKSNSGSESIATSDLNSGCSSFYRKNRHIVSNRSRKTLSDFVDSLSFDTVGTGSYCESLSRGNDLNSEIKDTITSLEYMPSETGDSTDLSHDFSTNAAFRSCSGNNSLSKDSAKFVSFNKPDCDSVNSSPSSSLYRTLGMGDSPSKIIKKMSPSLKSIKSRFRNSFRMDSKKSIKNDSFATDAFASDETTELKSCTSSSSGSSADVQRKKLFESICSRFESMPSESLANGLQMKGLIERIRQQQEMRKSIQSALAVCRTNGEFHNSRELVEAEQLMLMSSLKECLALEKLITLWQSDHVTVTKANELGEGVLTIKYLEFELKVDSIFDTHFNYFYVCVCSYCDQVEFTDSKERTNNRIVFNNLKMQFHDLAADFEIRVEIYALRLRKNPPTEKTSEPFVGKCDTSRFRLQGKTLLTSTNLSRKHVSSSYHSPRKLRRASNGKYVYTTHGLISPAIVVCGQGNTMCDTLKIGYQEQLYFVDSKANGFLNIADSKQKWDRLWCRIDGFSMNFWSYPQDVNDTQSPILTLNLDQCNYRTKSLLVDREICPRPRTFKIDVVHADIERRSRCIQSYFISAESQLDLELWLSEIQTIFEMIKSWNI